MRTTCYLVISAMELALTAYSAEEVSYTNYIRQFQSPTNVVWDSSAGVDPAGSRLSDLAINPTGARFELWTIANTSPVKSYLLSTAYVGSYVPVATVAIRTEDTYALIPRTRVDRPFYVDIEVSGLMSGPSDPAAAKSVKLTRHTQSYGIDGTGVNLDRTQATLNSQSSITTNGKQTITVAGWATQIAGWADPRRIRGEERFSIYSIEDKRETYVVPETTIGSKFIQIWPLADGMVSGISQNQTYKMVMPTLTLTLKDLYPSSTTYLQVYKGEKADGVVGEVVPGSNITRDDSLPYSPALVTIEGRRYESLLTSNGRWTMELLTSTPFGVTRLGYVSFNVDRTMSVKGSFTTIE